MATSDAAVRRCCGLFPAPLGVKGCWHCGNLQEFPPQAFNVLVNGLLQFAGKNLYCFWILGIQKLIAERSYPDLRSGRHLQSAVALPQPIVFSTLPWGLN